VYDGQGEVAVVTLLPFTPFNRAISNVFRDMGTGMAMAEKNR
jgi:hypothetical protein